MADFTAKDIQALRHETGTGMMDAKKALQDSGGDIEKAKDLLRERGLAAAAKRTDRAQSQGIIGSYLHQQAGRPVIGVMVDLACETDFVAKTDGFAEAANDIAMHIAAARPGWTDRDEVPADILEKERSLIAAQARNEGSPTTSLRRSWTGASTRSTKNTFCMTRSLFVPRSSMAPLGRW